MSTVSARCAASGRKRSFGRKILAPLEAFVIRWQRYRASCALAGLSDYMLKDMGVSRGETRPLDSGSPTYRICRGDDHTET